MDQEINAFLSDIEQLTLAVNDDKKPFETKYQAHEKINELLSKLQLQSDNNSQAIIYALNSIAARIAFDTLEMHKCRCHLTACEQYLCYTHTTVDVLEKLSQNQSLIQFSFLAFNTRSLIFGNQEQYSESKLIWKKTEELYEIVTNSEFYKFDEAETSLYKFYPEKYVQRALVNQFIHSLFFAAQVYGKSDEPAVSAELCGRTLSFQQQLNNYDKFEYIKNSIDLARYYSQNDKFVKTYEIFANIKGVIQSIIEKNKPIHQNKTKYILNEENLNEKDSVTEIPELMLDMNNENEDELFNKVISRDDDREQIYNYYRELGSFYLHVLEFLHLIQVKLVNYDTEAQFGSLLKELDDRQNLVKVSLSFQFLQEIIDQAVHNLQRALLFFKLDGWTSNYCKILLDISQCYDLNTKFCPYNLIQFQRKRIQLFEQLRKELNPIHFGAILEDMEDHLADAKYAIFDYQYKKMLQKNPRFESPIMTLSKEDQIECQKLCSLAAVSIEQFQAFITQVEKIAAERCKCQEGEHVTAQVQWERWVKWIHIDSLEIYMDACFRQSVVFSKFPSPDQRVRKQMMERALQGFEYCEKMWKWIQTNNKGDVDENLKLVNEMLTLMKVRISQL